MNTKPFELLSDIINILKQEKQFREKVRSIGVKSSNDSKLCIEITKKIKVYDKLTEHTTSNGMSAVVFEKQNNKTGRKDLCAVIYYNFNFKGGTKPIKHWITYLVIDYLDNMNAVELIQKHYRLTKLPDQKDGSVAIENIPGDGESNINCDMDCDNCSIPDLSKPIRQIIGEA